MQMEYGLPGIRPVADDDTKGIVDAELARDLVGREEQVSQ